MLLTDLQELKTVLEVDPTDTSEDAKFLLYAEWASAWILEVLGRQDLSLQSRSEVYQGTGTQNLTLRNRPVFTTPTPQVYIDESAHFGESSIPPNGPFPPSSMLNYGTDYELKIDQTNGSSRCGILVRIGNYWPRPQVRQSGLLSPFVGQDLGSIKVVYTAGFTIDTLPSQLRMAAVFLIARLRYVFPLGIELNSESYEDRSIGPVISDKQKLMALVWPLIAPYRNWKF